MAGLHFSGKENVMKKILLSVILAASFNANAATPVDTSLWTVQNSPSYNSTGSNWTSVGGNQAIQNLNSYGTLVSNFVETGDFTFSGTLRPTTASFNDNDILGIVFGWQDNQNHYRLGWEQGGYNDASGASGMWLVQELLGVSTILFQAENFWADNTDYNFLAGRSGNDISFSLNGISQSLTNTTFMSGNVGFYTESQTAIFSGLASVPQPPNAVPLPAAAFMFAPALLGFMGFRRRAKNLAA
jgi:hypothetical protein